MSAEIRKTSIVVEEIRSDIGRRVDPPTRKAAAIAVIRNPFAGRYEEDLTPLMDIGAELGGTLGDMCVNALGIRPDEAESYGKAAIVGERGRVGARRRDPASEARRAVAQAVEKGAALVPSVKKMAGRAPRSTSRSATRMRPMSAAISTGWRSASPTPRAPTRSWWPSRSPTRDAPSPRGRPHRRRGHGRGRAALGSQHFRQALRRRGVAASAGRDLAVDDHHADAGDVAIPTDSSRSLPAVCWARSIRTKSAARPSSISRNRAPASARCCRLRSRTRSRPGRRPARTASRPSSGYRAAEPPSPPGRRCRG